jgi:hypothetical protein
MWESRVLWAISKGGGKSGKAGFAFPRFPRSRHLHSCVWLIAGFLFPLCGALEAITVFSGVDDVRLIGNAIDQRFA